MEFKEAKDKLKKKNLFLFNFIQKKRKELYMVTPQKMRSYPLYQSAVGKKSTLQMLIHTQKGKWPISLLLILKFIH